MDCIEAVARLHLYIDRELNAEEIATVQEHLSDCPHCECRFHFDLRFKRLIHERCTIVQAPAHLREAVMRLAQLSPGESIDFDPELEMKLRADIADEDCV